MEVFISWSGETSHKIASFLNNLIPNVIQNVETFLSSKDIDRGSIWFVEITERLKKAKMGIVCLTRDNKDKPWIQFESGALAIGFSAKVCTFLVDIAYADLLENPLAQFNHTLPTKDSIFLLMQTINKCLGDNRVKENILKNSFESSWRNFENEFKMIIAGFDQRIKKIKIDNNIIENDLKNILNLNGYENRELEFKRIKIEIDRIVDLNERKKLSYEYLTNYVAHKKKK